MGIKLIILLALLVGVLYSLHLLVQDYQALSAPRLLRFLFKRDVSSQSYPKPSVRWKKILYHDPIQCARYLYCDLGARTADTDVKQGFAYMLTVPADILVGHKIHTLIAGFGLFGSLHQQTLEPQDEDKSAWDVFKEAYRFGKSLKYNESEKCRSKYFLCPFQTSLLFDLIQYLIQNDLN